jgi:hypothetical protein
MRTDEEVKAKLAEFEKAFNICNISQRDALTSYAMAIAMANWFLEGSKRCLADIARDPQAWTEWMQTILE